MIKTGGLLYRAKSSGQEGCVSRSYVAEFKSLDAEE